jgi:lipopolysaccharide assembly outer membrane protein LptD (OstA)
MPRAPVGSALALAAVLGLAAPLRAQETPPRASESLREELREGPLVVVAEEILYEEGRDLVEARRSVRAEVGGIVVSADWAVLRTGTLTGVAVGNVRIEQGGDTMIAEFAAFDLRALVAVASDAELRPEATGFVVRGATLRKTGEATYAIEQGDFTTCRCPPGTERLPWEVHAARADVEIDGYAVARGVVPRVAGVPVLYIPWVLFPVKTTRQTGFLTPTPGNSSRSGFELEAPFFFAPREDVNVLLRPIYLAKRGVKTGVEAEYVFGAEGETRGGVAALPGDDEVDRREAETRYSNDRWAAWLRHEQPLFPGIRFGADVARTSDNDYVLDFDDLDSATRQQRFLESRGWASFARRGRFASIEGVYSDDLQSPNDLDRDDYLLQRAPDAAIALLPRRILGLPLRLGLDTRYVYFHRSAEDAEIAGFAPVRGQFFDTGLDGLFDPYEPDLAGNFTGADNSQDNATSEGNGLFEEGELLADHGHRLELAPKLSLPARLGPAEAIAEVGVRQTLYDSDLRDTRGRTLGTLRVDTRTRLARDFRIADLPVRHVIEPKVGFALVSKQDQDRNPLFVPEPSVRMERLVNADPRLLTEDPSDRVGPEKYLEVSFANRLYAPARAAFSPARQLASLRLGSGYDFELGRVANLFAELELAPTEAVRIDGEVGYDSKEGQLDEARLLGQWSNPRGYGFSLEYRFLRDLPQVFEGFEYDSDVFDEFDPSFERINQASVSGLLPIAARLDAFAAGYLSFEDSSSKSGEIGVVIKSSCACWDLIPSVRHTSRPEDTRLQVEIRVTGIGFTRPSSRAQPWRDRMP